MSTDASPTNQSVLAVPGGDLERLQNSEHHDPHSLLGAHPVGDGLVVRTHHPDAEGCELLLDGEAWPMESIGGGVFGVLLPQHELPLAYELRFSFPDGSSWVRGDPYRFTPTVGEMDAYLFNEGTHRKLWMVLGAHVREHEGVRGTSFCV